MSRFGAFYYGERGLLDHSVDGHKVRCHVCGYWFAQLSGTHLIRHGLTADEYREEFELAKTTSLSSRSLTERRSIWGKTPERIARFTDPAVRARALAATLKSSGSAGRRRLETRQQPRFLEARTAAFAIGREVEISNKVARQIIKHCAVCGNEFRVRPSKAAQTTCKSECDYARRKKA